MQGESRYIKISTCRYSATKTSPWRPIQSIERRIVTKYWTSLWKNTVHHIKWYMTDLVNKSGGIWVPTNNSKVWNQRTCSQTKPIQPKPSGGVHPRTATQMGPHNILDILPKIIIVLHDTLRGQDNANYWIILIQYARTHTVRIPDREYAWYLTVLWLRFLW